MRTLFGRVKKLLQHKWTAKIRRKLRLKDVSTKWIPKKLCKRNLTQNEKGDKSTSKIQLENIPRLFKNIFEMIGILFKPRRIPVTHNHAKTARRLKIAQNRRQKKCYSQFKCENCHKCCISQTGRKLATRMQEHMLARRTHNPLSLLRIHQDRTGHYFNTNIVYINDQGKTRHWGDFRQ